MRLLVPVRLLRRHLPEMESEAHRAQRELSLRREDERPGAGDGIRTRDTKLGKLVLYQLSYTRSPNGSLYPLWMVLSRGAGRVQKSASRRRIAGNSLKYDSCLAGFFLNRKVSFLCHKKNADRSINLTWYQHRINQIFVGSGIGTRHATALQPVASEPGVWLGVGETWQCGSQPAGE